MVVTGGLKSSSIGLTSVELYVEGSNADNWTEGPTLPETYSFGQHIVSDDFSLYYINTWENKLRRLNCVRPTECQWISLGLTLKTPRHSAVVSLIPDNLASCRPSNKSLQLENKQN